LIIIVIAYLFVFIFGAIIGSFLNVCIYRIPREESIVAPPSHCTTCGTRLKALNLIPVFSYLWQKARCKQCGEKISARYITIELLTGFLYSALFYKFGIGTELVAMLFLTSVLIVIFFIDLEFGIIPNSIVIFASVGGLIFYITSFFIPTDIFGDRNWWNPLVGAFIGSIFLLLVAFIGSKIYKTDEVMGGGDIKVLFPIGLFLGWKLMVISLFISIVTAAVVCVVLILFHIINRKDTVPFGPFISIGTIIAIIFGWQLIGWYF